MKKIILSLSILLGLNTYSQTAMPTTTVGALEVKDSLNVIKDITAQRDVNINGEVTVKGEMLAKDTVRAMENILAKKDIKVDRNVYVNQDIMVEGKLTAKGGLTFDGTKGLFYTPATATTGDIFQLGSKVAAPTQNISLCLTPQSEPWSGFYFAGNFVSYLPAGSGTGATNSAIRIGMAPWNGNALIDVSGVGPSGTGTPGLEINTFCKRNTDINMGWDLTKTPEIDGGRVSMGAEVTMVRSLKIGYDGLTTIDPNTAIEVNQNTDNANGVKVKTWNNGVKAFAIERNDGKNTFTVYGSGTTYIGLERPLAPHIADTKLSVDGKIACKSLYVLKATTWADFVFKQKDLEKLENVEKYITKNKHLPGIPSEQEVLENGYDINEMDAKLLAKIETLYLHIIALEKEINQLKNK